jgi:mannose-6-phosphate isomerase-like protein (cupin superfamily)
MRAGECVLQPPGIRHRVLEASPGLEVIELGMPAVHPTHVDHELELPTAMIRADREFSSQRFVRFVPADARFSPAGIAGFEHCELGILGATRGLAAVRILRLHGDGGGTYVHDAELWFHVVLRGSLLLDGEQRLGPGDAFVIPAGQPFAWRDAAPDLELLEISLPGEPRLDVAR